jgi:hypothetical protein
MIGTIRQGNSFLFENIEFDSESKSFLLSNAEFGFNIEFPFYFDTEYNGVNFDQEVTDNYLLYILHKPNCPENYIYQIKEDSIDQRIGWIFPLNAIISRAHDYVNNQHFSRYAYIGMQKYLLTKQYTYFFDLGADISNLKITDLYQDNIILLVICKERLLGHEFDIVNYLPSLFSQNIFINNNSYEHQTDPLHIFLHLKKTSEHLIENPFVIELFTKLLFETHTLIKFFVLYQIIELLIEKILLSELRILSRKIEDKKLYTRDLRERISKFETEKDRIAKLFSEYLLIDSELIYNNLKTNCDNFLRQIGKEDQIPGTFYESLYSVRNFIFHDYRNLPNEVFETINEINFAFENLTIHVVLNFKQP